MRKGLIAGTLIVAAAVWAQDAPKPAQEAAKAEFTAEQIIEKSIEASGGRAVMEKMTSTTAKGTVDITFAPGSSATTELFAKAPNKRLIITTVEGFGVIRQGFDGTTAWAEDPNGGLREVKGAQLEQTKRESVFNGALKWRELYPKAELKGKEKIGDRDVYVIVLTPAAGKPVTQYFDAQTFLLTRQTMNVETEQGAMDIKAEFADYRDVNGVKAPFEIRQTLPMGDIIIKMTEIKNNVPIEDAKFEKPKS